MQDELSYKKKYKNIQQNLKMVGEPMQEMKQKKT